MGIKTEPLETTELREAGLKIKTEPTDLFEPSKANELIYAVGMQWYNRRTVHQEGISVFYRIDKAFRHLQTAIETAHRTWAAKFQEVYGDPLIVDIRNYPRNDHIDRQTVYALQPREDLSPNVARPYGGKWTDIFVHEIELQ